MTGRMTGRTTGRIGALVGALVLGVVAIAARAGVGAGASAPDGELVRHERAMMGSRVAISVWAAPGEADAARAAVDAALDDLAAWEARVSEWREGSDVARVNAAAGGAAVAIGDDAREVIARARSWAERTGGVFDPTGGPVFALWEDARRRGALPDPAALADARARVDWRAIELTDDGARLARAGMRLGLGAIGKGVAAERASARLATAGFGDHLVDCGGDLVVAGRRGAAPWKIALRGGDDEVLAVVALTTGSIATSGDAARSVVVDGVRYGHLLDLRTGWPARGVRSVTAYAPRDADPLATALFVLGPAAGAALLDAIDGAWAVWVTDDGAVVPSARAAIRDGRVEVRR